MKLKIILAIIFSFLMVTFVSKGEAFAEFRESNPNTNSGGYSTYNMGYRFTPNINGQINKLWCYGSGGSASSTVTLYTDGGSVLASTSVDCNNGVWAGGDISPVNVTAGTYYRVAMYGQAGFYTSAWTQGGTYGDITITEGVYGGGSGFPATSGGSYMYGFADVDVVGASSDETPFQTAFSSGYSGPTAWNYTMGYNFTPNVNGQITRLWCYSSGTKTVRLYRVSDQASLVSTSVNCSSGWGSAAITPVSVTAGTNYIVAMVVASSGGYSRSSSTGTFGNITINNGVYSSGDAYPTTNAGSTVYGLVDISFAPNPSSDPTISQATHSSITSTTATLGATVESDGGLSITSRGICWGTAANPSTNCQTSSGTTGTFTQARSGLPAGTLVYYRGYATNAQGTSYSPDGKFYTPSSGQEVAISIAGNVAESTLGSGTVSWSLPYEGRTSNNTYAIANLGNSQRSRYLLGTNFNFNIPDTATIDGIVVEGEYKTTTGVNIGMSGQLTKNGSSLTGGSKGTLYGIHTTESIDYLPAAMSKSDLWSTTWTPSEINASTFGVGLDTVVQTTGTSSYFDSMRILVYYTPATTPILASPTKADVVSYKATLGATVSSDNGSAVTSRGVCYAPTATDSTPGFTTAIGSTPESGVLCMETTGTTGAFTVLADFLTPNTAYTYRGYARNENGNGYSPTDTFTTPDGPIGPCDAPTKGSHTVDGACSFSGTVGGVDDGTGNQNTGVLTIQSGATLTVQPSQRIAWGSINLGQNAVVALFQGGQLVGGPVWIPDADQDGYIDSATGIVGSQPIGGVRRNTLQSTYPYLSRLADASGLDCDPTNGNIYTNVANLVTDTDQDGYKTSSSPSTKCVGESIVINGRTYYYGGL